MREMKNSGIEWIGEIPKIWDVSKLKFILKSNLQYGASEAGVQYNEKLPRYVRITDITPDNKLKEEGKLSLNERVAEGYILSDNDILFARSGASVGKSFIYKEKYGRSAFAGYLIRAQIDTRKAIPEFVYYNTLGIHYELWKNSIFNQATIQNIGADKYANFSMAIPTLEEQKRIVKCLDDKCSKIDDLIKKQQVTIEKLKEYELSVITETVTKGINANIKMKKAEIDLCVEIPSCWEIRQIRHLFQLRDEKNYNPLEEVQLLSLYTDLGVFPHGEQEERGNKAVKAEGYKVVYKDDIVVNIILAWMGAIGRSAYDGVTSPAYDIYKPVKYVYSKYYHYLFRTKAFSGECYKYGRGIMAMRWRTYSSEFKSIKVPVPPYEEQKEIAKYLDNKCEAIERTIDDRKRIIEKLNDYKKSFIYEVVTGKREV